MNTALVLNELSLVPDGTEHLSAAALDQFTSLLTALRKATSGAYLVSPTQVWGAGANAQTTFGPWASDPRNRDKLRQLVSLQNRAPIEEHFGVLSKEEVEDDYEFEGVPCIGLGYAHKLDLLAVSVLTRPVFDAPWLTVQHLWLESNDSDIAGDSVDVRHAARDTHVEEHRTWLTPPDPPTGSSLWETRRELFDRLEFIGRVESDCARLEGVVLASVTERLHELQGAAAEWNPAESPQPIWRSRVTPESASRITKGLCTFHDDEGGETVFSMHARYTPTAGRIHFRVDRARGKLVIAYIGPKLL